MAKIHSSLECIICSDLMHVPYVASCGHSFCYECLNSWFTNKLSCPTCRKEFEHPPILNVPLKNIVNSISEVLIECGNHENIRQSKKLAEDEHRKASRTNSLFDDVFKNSALTLIDTSDGVPRCGNCHWEAHGSVCLHCGTRFRIPRNDDYYDSEDGDAYNEDDEEIGDDGIENEYDSQDSFIDDGIHSNDGDNAHSSDEDREPWSGFNSDRSTENLHRALDNFNNEIIDIDDSNMDFDENGNQEVLVISSDPESADENVSGFAIDESRARRRRRKILDEDDEDDEEADDNDEDL